MRQLRGAERGIKRDVSAQQLPFEDGATDGEQLVRLERYGPRPHSRILRNQVCFRVSITAAR